MRRRKLIAVVCTAIVGAAFAGASATAVVRPDAGSDYLARVGKAGSDASPSGTVYLFTVSEVGGGVWYGVGNGADSATVTADFVSSRPSALRGTWTGITRWKVQSGASVFVVDGETKMNTNNGTLRLRGRVSGGAFAGQNVAIDGQLTAVNPHRFSGSIRVLDPAPASATEVR